MIASATCLTPVRVFVSLREPGTDVIAVQRSGLSGSKSVAFSAAPDDKEAAAAVKAARASPQVCCERKALN